MSCNVLPPLAGPDCHREGMDAFPSPDWPLCDMPSWQAGFRKGYQEGDSDGQVRGHQAERLALRDQLWTWKHDITLGLRHDLGTPLQVIDAVLSLVETSK
jgi:hypothetical protein